MVETASACERLSNDTVELLVARDFGPRIVHYGFVDGDNELGVAPDIERRTVLGVWRPRGGHRLWIAPESDPESYAPDDGEIECQFPDVRTLHVSRGPDAAGFAKEIRITIDPVGTGVVLTHRITNCGERDVRIAPWALTIMAGGGIAIIPQEPYRSHAEALAPARPLVLWHYTDLADHRLNAGSRLLTLTSDIARPAPQKIGVLNKQGWCAYHRSSSLFVKQFSFDPDQEYPDYNSNNQVFTAGAFIELETLGSLTTLRPGMIVEHRERWVLFRDIALDHRDPAASDAIVALINQ